VDAYKIGINIALANGVTPVLAVISRGLLGLNTQIATVQKGFTGWGVALGGVAAILGGAAMVKGMLALAEHGKDVNHQLELMKIAGMDNAEIQNSVAKSMKTSAAVQTTTLAENLAHIRELRYAFGETTTAMEHLDEISRSNAILNAINTKQGGGAAGHDQVWALVKSLEQKGLTYKPEEFRSYVDTMTKVVEATGGKVTPEMFMSTFKYGRTAMLGWDEAFIGGALPRLIQSMSSGGGGGGSGQGGPGNALMSAFAKVVQGQMPKKAASEWERMGLTPGGVSPIEGSSESMVGDITSKDLFMKNPYAWVQQVLMPALAAKGITAQNDVIEQISKMFPVRTAGQVITEMALQGKYAEGAGSPFEKDIALQKGAMGLAGYDELIKNDYPTLMKAFTQQFESMLQAIGSPLLQPGGPVLTAMSALTNMLTSMGQFAASNPEAIKYIAYSIGAIGAALVAIGAIALGTLIGIPAGLSAIAIAVGALAVLEWDKVRGYLLAFNDAMTNFINWLGGMAAQVQSIFEKLGIDKGGAGTSPGKTGKPWHPTSFDPGTSQPKLQQTAFSFNVDGRTLAQTVIEQMESLTEHATGAPAYNAQSHFARGDGGMAAV
jgi:hypothetical protein